MIAAPLFLVIVGYVLLLVRAIRAAGKVRELLTMQRHREAMFAVHSILGVQR